MTRHEKRLNARFIINLGLCALVGHETPVAPDVEITGTGTDTNMTITYRCARCGKELDD